MTTPDYGDKWRDDRPKHLRRAGHQCRFARTNGCRGQLTRHHKIPRLISRDDSASNVVVLCWRHHRVEEDRFWWKMDNLPDFRREIDRQFPDWWKAYRGRPERSRRERWKFGRPD